MAAAAYSPRGQPYHRAGVAAGKRSCRTGFDAPLWLADNDRLVLRDISARETLAGARVVTLNPPRRGKRKPEYLQWLAALAQARDDNAALRVHLERGAVSLSDFAWARQLSGEGLRQLTQQPGFIQAGNSLLDAPVLHTGSVSYLTPSRLTMNSIRMNPVLVVSACGAWRCRRKTMRWCCC